MPSTKKALSKYEKTNKILDIIKKSKLMNLNNLAIKDAIQFHTGRTVTDGQLTELIELAKREVREQQIEVDKHMEHMVKIGLYTDTMNNHEMLCTIEQIIYSLILEEAVKVDKTKNKNMILAMSNTLKNIIAAKDGLVTNIGFLAKIKNVYENTQAVDSSLSPVGPAIELNKKVNIMLKDQKTDVNKLIAEVIDKKELRITELPEQEQQEEEEEEQQRQTAKVTYRTDERDLLRKMAEKYKCSPFTGECWIEEVSLQKIKKFYHIILTEEQMEQFGDDFIVKEDSPAGGVIHQFLLMIKPSSEDNNYIIFRRK